MIVTQTKWWQWIEKCVGSGSEMKIELVRFLNT